MNARQRAIVGLVAGLLFITIGLAVFAIRLTHPGAYSMPQGGGFYGALGSVLLGAVLIWGRYRALTWAAVLISPLALFPSIYSIMGESEEVISLYAIDANNAPAELRLWIVDRDDGAWVGMPRAKAIEHSLDGAALSMLRAGIESCVVPRLYEDRPTVKSIHAMKVEKYRVAQLAGAIGLYPLEASESTVALRLSTCSD